MIKIDLHTHSIISSDGAGSITEDNFKKFLADGILDCIAITDHNETGFALNLHKKLGDKIIVGEEITSSEGEIVGLFLKKTIQPGLTAKQTINEIKKQNGLVYIPHPFEKFRNALGEKILKEIINEIDIFEVFNGRGLFRDKARVASEFAKKHDLASAASSDAHGFYGIGNTFSIIERIPDRNNLKKLLREGSLQEKYAPLMSYLYPVTNVIKNKLNLRKYYA